MGPEVLPFIAAIAPDLIGLAGELFKLHAGDIEKARATIRNHGTRLIESDKAQREELERIKAGK